MKSIDWKNLNYLRIIGIAIWIELQFYVVYLAFSKGTSWHQLQGTIFWQLLFLVGIIQATQKGPSCQTFFKVPVSGFQYYIFRIFAILILVTLLVVFLASSFLVINHFLPTGNTGLIVVAHFIGFSSAVVIAWIISEYIQTLFFRILTRSK